MGGTCSLRGRAARSIARVLSMLRASPGCTLSYAFRAALKPGVAILGHPRNACVTFASAAKAIVDNSAKKISSALNLESLLWCSTSMES